MKVQLTHIALHVQHLDECIRFYRDFCNMHEVMRHGEEPKPVVWLAEPGKEQQFVMVLIPGNRENGALNSGFSHLGFAVKSKKEVDQLADKARKQGCLLWEPRQDNYPAGYYCGVLDPQGNQVEFSYGQPLG